MELLKENLDGNLMKILPTQMKKIEEENQKTNENILAL